jgi:hypothetical protein
MSIDAYLNPDFIWYKKLFFFLISFVAISLCIIVIALIQRLRARGRDKEELMEDFEYLLFDQIQRLFEMIIAGTSVMMFSCSYVIINHIYTLITTGAASTDSEALKLLVTAWSEGKDFVLLFLICLSCVINTLVDSFIIPLTRLPRNEKATMRMLGMFYVIFVLIYLDRVGDESQYGPVMMYYFGLMVGRFVYFDASFRDFLENLKNMFFNLPYLVVNLMITGLLYYFGFSMDFFLERNYYIVGIFYTQLFMLACVFLIHWCFRIRYPEYRKKTN